MLQDIAPQQLDNRYQPSQRPQARDLVVVVDQHQVVLKDQVTFPTYEEAEAHWRFGINRYTYLLSVSGTAFFMVNAKVEPTATYQYSDQNRLRQLQPQWLAFGGATAAQLASWYATNQFCSQCGHRLEQDTNERALTCPNCQRKIYPTIAPAIIVAVKNGDRLLLTKFLEGYQKYALISGYTEIGETLEDTVRREVFEEVGLQVHNIRYYGSQPWAASHSLLVGYVADLDDDVAIQLERDELSKAQWFDRDKIPHDDTTASLTWNMIEAFRHHEF